MKYKYLVAGISIINDIEYADGRINKGIPGGCGIFAYGGIAFFEESVLLISSGGNDFMDYYGPYFRDNHLDPAGIYYDLPHTHHTLLKYEKDGSWNERSIYGDDYFALQSENNRTSFAKLKPFLSAETEGIYLDSNGEEAIFEEIPLIRKEAENVKIMWEPPTHTSKNPKLKERILHNLQLVDYYSMNLDEAAVFFSARSRDEIIEKASKLKTPCFLREGENGSTWIGNGTVYSYPAIGPEKAVDVTGCGNCSSAAALYWAVKSGKAQDIVINANLAAAYCSRFKGAANVYEARENKTAEKMRSEINI